ncbi:hypothetical protein T310_6105 [Rasamsonia emersonii CBS 393.64]|uniref:Uncharacterized protein n=1 Tax=Rasamsonia emersonii (strain ATCC 16479 / CBS 393.64 / IMI 116815) TaxID=1408163 RepID=A0A0F4YPX8_RASE3|nr:hypothetical protein T310_6105 [Rasamsonia emersonii CBS 393.64]KKA19906.1 hypothetical protein T310_6105 [Rasamsonia emersonii CBS 393.64]
MAMASDDEESRYNYRLAKPLPFELRQHCGIYFEEKLYSQALSLLLNILTCGTVASSPAFVPSPQHLALAATLLVHPSTTTRAKTTEEQEAANAALQLLRLTNTLVGPVAAKFDVAFTFTHFDSSRHGGRRRADDSGTASGVRDDENAPLNLDLGQSGSLWSRAEDFWHAVGWAFNCSVLHPNRWERWQLWLEFMCEALEDDWSERKRQLEDLGESSQPGTPSKRREAILKQSLIFKFLTSNTTYGRNRRILRAIFANGSPTSVNEFREVFKNELKELKREEDGKLKKREVDVNIDEGQYGDYMSLDEEESDEVEMTRTRPKRARRGAKRGESAARTAENDSYELPDSIYADGGVASLGGFKSLALRQRLLHLLSEVSQYLPDAFIRLEELYHLFVENIRHLPLPIFQAFVAPSALSYFTAAEQSSLCEILLYRMRESAAPESDEAYLSQKKLEECFLPYAANTASVVDNAKVSILLESLLRLLAEDNLLRNTPELRQAVTEGILARNEKAQVEVRRSQNSRRMEDIEWCWLIESGERLLFLVEDILPQEQDSAPQS